MPDGLFYPISAMSWTSEGMKTNSDFDKYFSLLWLHKAATEKISARHKLRQMRYRQLVAFQKTTRFPPLFLGFHKTRALSSGFNVKKLEEWQQEWEVWKLHSPKEDVLKVEEVQAIVDSMIKDLSKLILLEGEAK
jgi:hypothetical protein